MEYVNTVVSGEGINDVVTGTQTVSLRAVVVQLDVVLMIGRFISIAVAEVRVQNTVPEPVIEGLRVVVGIVVVGGSSDGMQLVVVEGKHLVMIPTEVVVGVVRGFDVVPLSGMQLAAVVGKHSVVMGSVVVLDFLDDIHVGSVIGKQSEISVPGVVNGVDVVNNAAGRH